MSQFPHNYITRGEFNDFKDHVDKKFDSIDTKFDLIDQKFDLIDKKFDLIDKRFDKVYEEFAKFDRKFEYLTELMIAGFDRIYTRIDEVVASATPYEEHRDLERRVDALEEVIVEKI